MAYEPPKYPSEIPTAEDLPDRTDDIDWLYAARYNELKKELRATLIELGTDPAGAFATVKARLDAIPIIPPGLIAMWSGLLANIPDGWALCDGGDGRPDLRDKFIVGAGNEYAVGNTGGEKTHTLSIAEMPAHIHTYTSPRADGGAWYGALPSVAGAVRNTSSTGGDGAHENRPPYYALYYIIKT